jgi:integrase
MAIRDKATSKGQVGGIRVIPLTPYVASLLMNLPRRNQWVFSSPNGASGKLVDPRKSYNPALIAAGIEGLTLHGLRRSFATLSEWVEVPTGVVAQIMGHKPSATAEKHYKKRPLDLLRLWHERIETWVLNQAGVEIPVINDQKLVLVKGL